jgi:hypothetical protein
MFISRLQCTTVMVTHVCVVCGCTQAQANTLRQVLDVRRVCYVMLCYAM